MVTHGVDRPLRIAQVAPLAEAVPPRLYGGTERIVSFLTEALVDRGHEVTLFASGDSVTTASLVPILPRALRLARHRPDPLAACAALLEEVAQAASDFDVIHAHLDWVHLPILRRIGVPFLTTLHNRLDVPHLADTMRRFRDAPFVSISDDQRRPLPEMNWVGTVHHGIPAESLRWPPDATEGYLAFLGRIAPEKGPDIAVRLANEAGLPLRIAAKIPGSQHRFFKNQIEPHVDGTRVRFVGEIADDRKAEFLGKAAALLFPIKWPEPFGLVMIEAMACGTPVIAFRAGAVCEVVDHGITGFIVESESEALSAIRRIGELDRARVRARFDERFTACRMADDYVRLYRKLASSNSQVLELA